MTSRCTGHCCKRLTIPFGPEELKEVARTAECHEKWHAAHRALQSSPDKLISTWEEAKAALGPEPTGKWYNDIEQIAEMLEYIGYTAPDPEQHNTKTNEPRHWYRCTKLLPNGDCGIYATRPKMCSEYPYGERCYYKACTWDPKDYIPQHPTLRVLP